MGARSIGSMALTLLSKGKDRIQIDLPLKASFIQRRFRYPKVNCYCTVLFIVTSLSLFLYKI
ncbi:MAG TPA: hypothetical protein V6D26_31965, partial [Stenomitos sp.]